ncbi:MAG: hypothetical protein RLO17_05790 [Cyclobacteriaceae bacterium]
MKQIILLILLTTLASCNRKSIPAQITSPNTLENKSTEQTPIDPDAKPLILLDSEEVTSKEQLDAVDPNEIESIEVIKDFEAAIQLYGEKAKNGVVLIKTKEYEQKKKQQIYEKLQQHLKNYVDNESDYLFVLDGIVITENNVEKLFELEPLEITVVEELTEKAAAVIYDTPPKKYTILINTKRDN